MTETTRPIIEDNMLQLLEDLFEQAKIITADTTAPTIQENIDEPIFTFVVDGTSYNLYIQAFGRLFKSADFTEVT